jgi:hypothetical protein
MPDRGTLDLMTVAARPLHAARDASWRLQGARWAQVTFEVDQAAALSRLPMDAGRPVPAYARLLVLEATASAAGPFCVAALAVGGRYRLLPRNISADIVVDGAVEAIAGAIGGPCRAGQVSLVREGSRVTATVSDAEAGELATLTLPELRAIDPGMLRWDAWLTFVDRDGVTVLAEFAPAARPTEAFLSKGATVEAGASLPRRHLWRQFRNLQTVSACYCEGDFDLPAPEVQT